MIATMGRTGGRKAEFVENLRRHRPQLFGFIHSLVRNYDDADDVFQQTSLVLWRKYEQFDPARSFVVWACGVARFEVAKFRRSRLRQGRYLSDDVCLLMIDVQAELEKEPLDERRGALMECLKKLRPRDHELLLACYDGSARVPEVARDRGRSPQSIHNTLRRIRRTLYECVQRTLGAEGTR
jgi:RNA polymerase sigma-70 factor (ECF subfamily)